MRATLCFICLCLPLAGCGVDSLREHQESNIMSSLPYDGTPCDALKAKRATLMARYGLSQDAKPIMGDTPLGLGPIMPDMRSARQKGAEQARGEIDAMNRSMVRRKCIPAPPKA
ncbi:MAG: hypothetical protein J0I98_09840 [Mesorhizobium sp.]|nr:hypothetical protein [Mesorhizobium sp.]MBN9243085.1 hypothetical protein [Mesorhizobium sp.]